MGGGECVWKLEETGKQMYNSIIESITHVEHPSILPLSLHLRTLLPPHNLTHGTSIRPISSQNPQGGGSEDTDSNPAPAPAPARPAEDGDTQRIDDDDDVRTAAANGRNESAKEKKEDNDEDVPQD